MKLHRHLIISAVVLFFVALIPFVASASEPATYNKVVVFGDSLSDNGNLYRTDLGLMPKSPPYYQGRFSNGPTWADIAEKYLTDKYNVTTANYAVGGETVNLHNPIQGFLPYTFTNSLDSYYLHTVFTDRTHTLFIIWLGANDYLNGAKDPEEATTAVANTIQTNINSLIAAGAKNFLVLNLPDLAVTPFAATSPDPKVLHTLTMLHNVKLQAVVDATQAQHKDVIIRSLDVYGLYEDLAKNLDAYNQKYHTHISNMDTACWTGGYLYNKMAMTNQEDEIARSLENDYNKKSVNLTSQNKNDINFNGMAHYIAANPDLMVAYNVTKSYAEGKVPCSSPEDYAFWDHVHPTAPVHTIIASILIDNINQFYHFN
jgi:phospholipase/lecithinase/hemolysin